MNLIRSLTDLTGKRQYLREGCVEVSSISNSGICREACTVDAKALVGAEAIQAKCLVYQFQVPLARFSACISQTVSVPWLLRVPVEMK